MYPFRRAHPRLLVAAVVLAWLIAGPLPVRHGLDGSGLLRSAHAQTPGVRYIYDDLNRLVGVVDQSGEASILTYDAVGNILSIERLSAGTVSIVEFRPKRGPAGAGTTVTLFGAGFSPVATDNSVTFNGVPAPVSSATSTQIVTSVPAGATTGPIAVTAPSGTATSRVPFTVTTPPGPPSLASFTPGLGSAGMTTSLAGTNFDTVPTGNTVRFNGTRAVVSAASETTLSAVVPAAGTSGRISVATAAGTATSAADFFIPPSPYTPANVEATARIAFGQSRTVTIAGSNNIALLVFDGTVGQRVSLKALSSSSSGAVSINNPDGSRLASTGLGGAAGFLDTRLLPVTGTYTILVETRATVTVSLFEVPPDVTGSITAGGPSVSVTIATPGQKARLTFSGGAGQRVSLNLTAVTLSSVVSLLDPGGATLASVTSGSQSFLGATTLPVAGTYTVFVNPIVFNTGSLTLTLFDVPPDLTGSITPGGPPATLTFTTPGQNGRLSFPGTAGQRISLNVSQVTLAFVTVSINRPDGTLLTNAGVGTAGTFFEPLTLPVTGTYTIGLDPRDANTGSLTLTLYDVPPDVTGTLTVGGGGLTVTIAAGGQNATLSFDGTAGQVVTVRVTGNTIGLVSVTLRRASGSTLTSLASSAASFNLASHTLPATETYTIRLDPIGAGTGSATVQVTSP